MTIRIHGNVGAAINVERGAVVVFQMDRGKHTYCGCAERLTERERQLLNSYRNICNDNDKQTIERIAFLWMCKPRRRDERPSINRNCADAVAISC